MVIKHVYISGRVQGVYYREYTRRQAERLGIKGWVKNLSDGRVEAIFAGDAAAVDKMLEWCNHGSPNANVTGIEVAEGPVEEQFSDFKIKF
ncbi:acylphosphatase [Desulfotomaculum arcticum]|uniref:acylphosphatase n=1 Tax=Desulfotruncus arcticus DSM 17038 TaxID=1121424 RepID=A0A1I2ZMQ3_9FIRM|nr:acylphosphatase [Desulfotruncus arcticus]SFH38935.1 acylphosphatase [Desulfotomaculum arcticum] [Desulfotruncus arcticus DSM 17038]